MTLPHEQALKKIRAQLSENDGFLMLAPDADELARFRFKICQELLKYAHRQNVSAAELAKSLAISKAEMMRIFNHRIARMSTDKLIRLVTKIYPHLRLKMTRR